MQNRLTCFGTRTDNKLVALFQKPFNNPVRHLAALFQMAPMPLTDGCIGIMYGVCGPAIMLEKLHSLML